MYKKVNESGELLFPKETARIDRLLRESASIQAKLGKDSTEVEVKKAMRLIFNRELKIRDIDPEFYKILNPYNDEDEYTTK
jgi:hypothetical protein